MRFVAVRVQEKLAAKTQAALYGREKDTETKVRRCPPAAATATLEGVALGGLLSRSSLEGLAHEWARFSRPVQAAVLFGDRQARHTCLLDVDLVAGPEAAGANEPPVHQHGVGPRKDIRRRLVQLRLRLRHRPVHDEK
jgi:hypothetical protein